MDLILKVKAADDKLQSNNQAKKVYAETGDAKRALLLCDKQKQTVEKKLLEGLVKHHQNNSLNALDNVNSLSLLLTFSSRCKCAISMSVSVVLDSEVC